MNGRIPQRQQQGGDQRQRIGDAPRRHNLLQQQQGMLNIPPAVDRRQGNQVRRGGQNPPGLQGGPHGQQARGADIQRQNAGIPQQPQPANANVQGPQQPQYRPQQNAVVAGVPQQAHGAHIQRQNAGIPQQPQPTNANLQGFQQPQYRPQQNAGVPQQPIPAYANVQGRHQPQCIPQ